MKVALRPVDVEDLEALAPLDAAYAAEHAVAPVVGAAALAFYARSGHAFVAGPTAAPTGFVLAQAIWDGARPTVSIARLVARDGDGDLHRALVEAVVKSAYDAAVYDLTVDLPTSDALGAAAFAAPWRERPVRRFERVLGARSVRTDG